LLQEYTRSPQTIIISTHQIEEMENLLEQVIILNEGGIILDDSLECIKEKAYYLTGREEHLEKLESLKGKSPKQKFGKMRTYACYGRLNKQELNYIESHDIEYRPMELQKLFIELTKGKEFSYERN
ncbi:MAG: ABC transporter ATP-binding protein, partial [Cellulosilyticaceae bacterium]